MCRPGPCALVNLKDRTWCWLHKNGLAFLILVLEGLGLDPKQIGSCKLNTENHSCPKICLWPLNAFHHPKQLSSFQTGACKEWKVFASNSSKSISKTHTHAHSWSLHPLLSLEASHGRTQAPSLTCLDKGGLSRWISVWSGGHCCWL